MPVNTGYPYNRNVSASVGGPNVAACVVSFTVGPTMLALNRWICARTLAAGSGHRDGRGNSKRATIGHLMERTTDPSTLTTSTQCVAYMLVVVTDHAPRAFGLGNG